MKSAFVFVSVILSTTAFAGQKLSYNQLKEACQKPESFHNQNKPANMEISCEDRQTSWEATGNGNYLLPKMRKVTIAMISDKYEVPGQTKDKVTQQHSAACPKFKEVLETVKLTRATTCEEILTFNGNEVEFCAKEIDAIRGSAPDSIKKEYTNREASICGVSTNAPGKPGK